MSGKKSLKNTVFREFLIDQSLGPTEMSKKLDANYNSVKATFAKLVKEGFLERLSRGKYKVNIPSIIIQLMERVEALEKKG